MTNQTREHSRSPTALPCARQIRSTKAVLSLRVRSEPGLLPLFLVQFLSPSLSHFSSIFFMNFRTWPSSSQGDFAEEPRADQGAYAHPRGTNEFPRSSAR